MSEHAEFRDEYQIAVARMNPAVTADGLRATLGTRPDAEAVVLEGYATGATPECINSVIQEYTDKGIPVFVVSSNYARDTGIEKTSYDSHVKAREAGAIYIQSKNVNHFSDILNAIQDEIDSGKRGAELAQVIETMHKQQ